MERPAPLRFLVLLATSALVAAAGILAYNAFAQATGENRQPVEWYVAREMLAGHHMVPPNNPNEGELRWAIAVQLAGQPVDVAVFGSSHGLLVTRKTVPAPRLFNFSISGASLAEHLVTSSLLERHGAKTKVMLVFLDPWLFNRGTDFSMWKARTEEMRRYETTLCNQKPEIRPVFTPKVDGDGGFSLRENYRLAPLIALLDDLYGHLPFNLQQIADPDKVSFTVYRADGGTQLNGDHGRDSEAQARAIALKQFANAIDPHRYGTYDSIDEDLWKLFERWISHSHERGTEIWFVYPAYHPVLYSRIIADPKNKLRQIEARATQLARRVDAKVFGGYNPANSGLTEDCFVDGDHLNDQGIRRLLAGAAKEWETRQAQP